MTQTYITPVRDNLLSLTFKEVALAETFSTESSWPSRYVLHLASLSPDMCHSSKSQLEYEEGHNEYVRKRQRK